MRGLFTFILAALAALTLTMVSCQKEPTVEPSTLDDVWEIEIDGQTKANLTKNLILIANPNGRIKATLKKNGSEYVDHEDVTWSWTGGNVKATRIGDGSKNGVSNCSLTANSSGSETVYVTASVGSVPGASIPTKSINVNVYSATPIIVVTQEDIGYPLTGVRLTASLDFYSGLHGFDYSGENISVNFNARCFLENLVDKADYPSKPSNSWQDGGDKWLWQHPWENTSSFTLNANKTSGSVVLDWNAKVCDGWASHFGSNPTPPEMQSGDFTLEFSGLSNIEDFVYNETDDFEYLPR